MRTSYRLCQQSARVLLFTRQNCSLCEVAKGVLNDVAKKRVFDYQEIDVMRKGHEQWKKLYQYETPVVHIQSVQHTYAKKDLVVEVAQIYHRLDNAEVEKLLDKAESGF